MPVTVARGLSGSPSGTCWAMPWLCVPRISSAAVTCGVAFLASGRDDHRHVPAVRLPVITRTASWLRLSQREETWKIAEILLLRHQLAVLQRRQPRRPDLDWADRALHATLLAVIPKGAPLRAAAAGIPGHDRALAPRHRPPPLGRQVHPRQAGKAWPPAATSGPWSSGWPGRTPAGATAGSTAS